MPVTRFQKAVFGLILSYAMACGMEVYNVAIKLGYTLSPGGLSAMGMEVFPAALREASYMGLLVFLVSNLWGNRIGVYLSSRHADPKTDSPYICRLIRQGCTVGVMCPSMSLVASILFSVILEREPVRRLPAIWVGTVLKNFPMALLWNLYAAAPFAHGLFGLLFRQNQKR